MPTTRALYAEGHVF